MKKILAIITCILWINCAAQQIEITNLIQESLKNGIVLLRQDYQLVDENESEIKNASGKDYWSRTYYVIPRISDNSLLLPGDAIRPWIKESLSKNDRFQPAISSTAIRTLGGYEFENIDFDPDNLTEIRENRLYAMEGSEEPGFSLISGEGKTCGYGVFIVPETPLSEDNETNKFTFEIFPMTYVLNESKGLYDVNTKVSDNAMGGVYIVPVSLRPGLIEFYLIGMFQKIGGVFRLVIPDYGTEMKSTSYIESAESLWLNSVMNGIESGMNDFFSTIGL